MQRTEVQALECLQHGSVVLRSQSLGYMHLVVWIDADEVGVERGVMDLREWDAVGHDRLPQPVVMIDGFSANAKDSP